MDNQIKVFAFDMKQVRVFEKENEPWFVANDVAKVLGYTNPSKATNTHCKKSQVVWGNDSLGRRQEFKIIPESDVYRLVFRSKLPQAEKFEDWVVTEVVPNIRKHGAHLTPDTIEKVLTDPDTIIQIATQLKEERAKRMQAEVVIEQQKPKVLFADAVEASDSSILIGQLAKLITQNGLRIGQNNLFKWLRDQGYLGRKGAHYNEPTQYAVERGWFEVVERTVPKSDGSVRITRTTKVTGKGQIYFINKLLTQAM